MRCVSWLAVYEAIHSLMFSCNTNSFWCNEGRGTVSSLARPHCKVTTTVVYVVDRPLGFHLIISQFFACNHKWSTLMAFWTQFKIDSKPQRWFHFTLTLPANTQSTSFIPGGCLLLEIPHISSIFLVQAFLPLKAALYWFFSSSLFLPTQAFLLFAK